VTSQITRARAGREPDPGPFRGAPEWLWTPLVDWLETLLMPGTSKEDTKTGHRVMARLRIPAVNWVHKRGPWASIEVWFEEDDSGERLLDVVHVVIQVRPADYERVDALLSDGGSAYAATERGIEDRVDATAQRAFDAAINPRDQASAELSEAWSKAYGREPDQSDAWDHSIKAVEAVLRPIVCPNDTKATLGRIIGLLGSTTDPWKFLLRGQDRDYSVDALVDMLKLMWPDPNRHGSATPEPPATFEEARYVVQLAVTIVQWGRNDQMVKK
jgi:hypothetical protein